MNFYYVIGFFIYLFFIFLVIMTHLCMAFDCHLIKVLKDIQMMRDNII
jgi:hypothetical protein